ncbi:hypothetical protein B484DRAFT_458288 [Ochromonadaceae sp. CCMP2298]|nr:hypothetical protein B484DRAFT_458288 [Ochromonadaceae sp. CCMP2298]
MCIPSPAVSSVLLLLPRTAVRISNLGAQTREGLSWAALQGVPVVGGGAFAPTSACRAVIRAQQRRQEQRRHNMRVQELQDDCVHLCAGRRELREGGQWRGLRTYPWYGYPGYGYPGYQYPRYLYPGYHTQGTQKRLCSCA